MKELAFEWIQKAEGDYATPERVTPTNAELFRNTESTEETQSFAEFLSVSLCAFSVGLCVPVWTLAVLITRSGYATTGRETRARRQPNYDAACFHAQQAAEKYLKAFLQEHDMPFPRTHNLIALWELCLGLDEGFKVLRDPLILLDRYAVRYCYPGESADRDEARQALKAVTGVRGFMRAKMGFW